jgi:hypothetical protein
MQMLKVWRMRKLASKLGLKLALHLCQKFVSSNASAIPV